MLKLSKTIIILQLKGSHIKLHIKNMITSAETASPENFTLTSFPVLRLLTRKEFVKYGNSKRLPSNKRRISKYDTY